MCLFSHYIGNVESNESKSTATCENMTPNIICVTNRDDEGKTPYATENNSVSPKPDNQLSKIFDGDKLAKCLVETLETTIPERKVFIELEKESLQQQSDVNISENNKPGLTEKLSGISDKELIINNCENTADVINKENIPPMNVKCAEYADNLINDKIDNKKTNNKFMECPLKMISDVTDFADVSLENDVNSLKVHKCTSKKPDINSRNVTQLLDPSILIFGNENLKLTLPKQYQNKIIADLNLWRKNVLRYHQKMLNRSIRFSWPSCLGETKRHELREKQYAPNCIEYINEEAPSASENSFEMELDNTSRMRSEGTGLFVRRLSCPQLRITCK